MANYFMLTCNPGASRQAGGMKTILASKPFIAAELLLLVIGLPAAIIEFDLIRHMLGILWVAAVYCLVIHRITTGERLRDVWKFREITRDSAKPMLRMLGLAILFLGAATAFLLPERLFSFVLERPALWAMVMLLYPLLSVLPQEIIFRLFFFERYKPFFASGTTMVVASGLAFGFAHIIFLNWVAPLLTALGGLIFALTYSRRRSLALVSLEHALYGNFIFTIGLGIYFYHGSVAAISTVAN